MHDFNRNVNYKGHLITWRTDDLGQRATIYVRTYGRAYYGEGIAYEHTTWKTLNIAPFANVPMAKSFIDLAQKVLAK